MNLGIFLQPGESLTSMAKSGQSDRFINFYLKKYCLEFEKVYIFSYEKDSGFELPPNVIVIPKKNNFHRLIYGLLLPLVNKKELAKCEVVRGFSLTSSISALFLNKPFVVNWAYDYISFAKVDRKYVYIPGYWLLEKLAFFKAKRVFIATKSKFDSLNSKKFIFLPNGVDLKKFKPSSKKGQGLLFVGRLEKQKNLFFLIDALKYLPQVSRKITLVGDGSLYDQLRKYAKKSKIEARFVKKIENTRMSQFYGKFKIFTLPSWEEGSSKVLIEAMACGLVPVVTNFRTAQDVVEDGKNGLISQFDVQEYANLIDKLLENDDIVNKLSKEASKKIRMNFDLSKQLSKEIEVLKNV